MISAKTQRQVSAAAIALLTCAAAHAGIIGVDVTEVDFSNGYVFADGSIHEASAHLVPDAQPPCTKTLRLWALVESPQDTIAYFGASADDGVQFHYSPNGAPAYNSPLGKSVDATNPAWFSFVPELAYDSWLTIGHDGGPNTSGGTSIQDDGWTMPWSMGESFVSNGGGLLDTSPSAGEDVFEGSFGYRVLLGQFTVGVGQCFEISGRIGGGGESFDFSFHCYSSFFGACCLPDGTCGQKQGIGIQDVCLNRGGIFHPSTCCEDVVCPPVLGACCVDHACTMQEPEACHDQGGTYRGDQELCWCPQDVANPASFSPYGTSDGVVNASDLMITLLFFGSTAERFDSAPVYPDGTHGNGIVNIDDVIGILNAWGPCSVCNE